VPHKVLEAIGGGDHCGEDRIQRTETISLMAFDNGADNAVHIRVVVVQRLPRDTGLPGNGGHGDIAQTVF
jgi:hypothetical protein